MTNVKTKTKVIGLLYDATYFKVYMSDIGLLSRRLGVSIMIICRKMIP